MNADSLKGLQAYFIFKAISFCEGGFKHGLACLLTEVSASFIDVAAQCKHGSNTCHVHAVFATLWM